MQFLAILNFTAAIQGLFLSYLLFNKKGDAPEYRLLALLVLAMSLAILGPVMGLTGYYRQLPHLIRVSEPLGLLIGPLLYFYIYFITKGNLPNRFYLHLAPFAIFLVWLIPFYALSGLEKIAAVDQMLKSNSPNFPMHAIRVLHISLYIIGSLQLVRQFRKVLQFNFSDLNKFNLEKSAFLLKIFLVLVITGYGIYFLNFFIPLNFLLINTISSLAISIIIYALAYFTWNRPALIPVTQLISPVQEVATSGTPVSNSSTTEEAVKTTEEKTRIIHHLSDDQYSILTKRLEQLLNQERVFLENELSLQQLSGYLNIPPYQTSELINRHYQESFFDLINRFRVEEVKKRLQNESYSHYSILGVALDCGFNSKSSFNTAFKKFTGLTPSEYRKNLAVVTV